jgi:type IV pilus assembly protein PilE
MFGKNKGFSLLELLIVIALLGILASIALLRYGAVFERTREAQAKAVLSQIVSAEKRYFIENDNYTATITNLDSFESDIPVRDFNFSVVVSGNASYAQAKKITGANSYMMCLSNAKNVTCTNAADCSGFAGNCP